MADFVALAVDWGCTTGMQAFCRSQTFISDHERLFSVMFRPDCGLVVHKHESVDLSPAAVAAGRELEAC